MVDKLQPKDVVVSIDDEPDILKRYQVPKLEVSTSRELAEIFLALEVEANTQCLAEAVLVAS